MSYAGTALIRKARPGCGQSVEWNSTTLPWWGLWEDGGAISRTTFAALFAQIGTAFGVGDGSTTFNKPDSRGRAAVAKDDQGGAAANRVTVGGSGITGTTLGNAGGAETVALTTAQLASHPHQQQHIDAVASPRSSNSAAAGSSPQPAVESGASGSNPLNTLSAGSGSAHQNMPPTIIKTKVICWAP